MIKNIVIVILLVISAFFGYQYFNNLDIIKKSKLCRHFLALLEENDSLAKLKLTLPTPCDTTEKYANNYYNSVDPSLRPMEPAYFEIPNNELAQLVASLQNKSILVLGRRWKDNKYSICPILFPKNGNINQRFPNYPNETNETFPVLKYLNQMNPNEYKILFNCPQ